MKKKLLARALVGAVAAVCLVPMGLGSPAAAEDLSFYETPTTLPARNGDIVRAEASEFYVDPIKLIKADAKVQRIMYRTTDRSGKPIAVTGNMLTPNKAWNGRGQRPLIGYAVGTQGLGDDCAPSRSMGKGLEYEGPVIAALLARGFAVVVTDYQGLGTEGLHRYMVREVQGHAVLDAVRAAQRLPGSGVTATNPVAIVGYSQGGGAAASAAELAPAYAPELNLKGVVAGAVPADLAAVAKKLDGSLYVSFLGYAVASMAAEYGIDMGPLLNAQGKEMMAELEDQCTVESLATFPFVDSEDITADGRPVTALLDEAPFRDIVADQLIGNGRAPRVPVLVHHSLLDDVIPYSAGKSMASRWCRRGTNVSFNTLATPTHVGGYVASVPETLVFLEARFAGLPQLSSCWRL